MDKEKIISEIMELVKVNARYCTGADGITPYTGEDAILKDKWALNVNLWSLKTDIEHLLHSLEFKQKHGNKK